MTKEQRMAEKLLKLENPEEDAVWKVEGENQSQGNMGERDYYPNLGLWQGKYKDVVGKVVGMRSFWGPAGRGGWISKATINKA